MIMRRLGKSNLTVSAIGLGCWAIGGPWTFVDHAAGWGQVDDAESIRAIHCALDAGINFLDTAANYGCGHSERILGQAIAGRRDRVIIATKFGYVVDEQKRIVTIGDTRPKRTPLECEASLRRLNTDYIDLFQLHVGNYDLARIPDLQEVLEKLVADGKIRWYGWSTDNADGARVFAQGQHATAILHFMNMANDAPQMLALCGELDQASINRTPLGGGLLTGKFTQDSEFAEDDLRHSWNLKEGRLAERLSHVEAARESLMEGGRTLAQAALGWLLTRSDRTIPIPGFRSVAQAKENIQAMEYGLLSNEQMKKIDEIFGRSPVVT